MSSKLTGEGPQEKERILSRLEDNTPQRKVNVQGGVLVDVEGDDYGKKLGKVKVYFRFQNLERSSVGQCFNIFGVPVLSNSGLFCMVWNRL